MSNGFVLGGEFVLEPLDAGFGSAEASSWEAPLSAPEPDTAYFAFADPTAAPVSFEPNDTLATAAFLAEGTYQVAGMNRDWYRISTDMGPINLVMTPLNGADHNMILYNSAGQAILANFQGGGSAETLNYFSNSKADYFVEVWSTGSSTNSYSLAVDVSTATYAYEPNDTRETAVTLAQGTFQISGLNDDWFKIAVNPGPVAFSMTPRVGTDVNMILYNAAGQVVGANFQAGTEAFTWESNISGFVWLKVAPTAGNASEYGLTIDTPENSWAKTLPFGPINNASVAFYDIDEDGKDEIFIGTSKLLDAQNNEIRPAGLIVLEDDGTVKWTLSFPSIGKPDPQTGKTYTSTSVTTAPAFHDVDGDGNIDILIGVGGDTSGSNLAISGQPGDLGGLYAVNRNGTIKWFHQSMDIIGGDLELGEGRPDGVHGAPVAFDLDRDGVLEVIYNGWDQRTWILNGPDGKAERSVHLLDTIWSTPKIADINGDGIFEILVSADVTQHEPAWTQTGGIFHVLSADLSQNMPGWNQPVANPAYTTLRGKFEEQTLWSSPITVDLEGDGTLEIIYGTGNFHKDARGSYIRVWNHDGTLAYTLDTGDGRTFATPLAADLDGDGRPEIVAATLDGWVYAWNFKGEQLWKTNSQPFGGTLTEPIFSSPLAVDLNGDGKLEILYNQGAQLVVLSHLGVQLSSKTVPENIFQAFTGTPAVRDIDGDGRLEVVSGGRSADGQNAVVYRWDNPLGDFTGTFRDGKYQAHQNLTNIQTFVEQFYVDILNRASEPRGQNGWTDLLVTGVRSGADVARGFIFSTEFTNRGVNNDDFVDVLYSAFFNREADAVGKAYWKGKLDGGESRFDVLNGFILSQEFANLCAVYGIVPSF